MTLGFTLTSCWQCREQWYVRDAVIDMARKSGTPVHCPFGHKGYWKLGKTDLEIANEKLEAERRARQRAEQSAAYQEDCARHERNRANGYKGHATRITKRAKAGVCPCCNRSFENLRRHMATKHPQFTPMELEDKPALEVIDGGKADAA